MTTNYQIPTNSPNNQISKILSTGESSRLTNSNISQAPIVRTIIKPGKFNYIAKSFIFQYLNNQFIYLAGTQNIHTQLANQNIGLIKTISKPTTAVNSALQKQPSTIQLSQANLSSIVNRQMTPTSSKAPAILSLVNNRNSPKPIIFTKRINSTGPFGQVITSPNMTVTQAPSPAAASLNKFPAVQLQNKLPSTTIISPNNSQKVIQYSINFKILKKIAYKNLE